MLRIGGLRPFGFEGRRIEAVFPGDARLALLTQLEGNVRSLRVEDQGLERHAVEPQVAVRSPDGQQPLHAERRGARELAVRGVAHAQAQRLRAAAQRGEELVAERNLHLPVVGLVDGDARVGVVEQVVRRAAAVEHDILDRREVRDLVGDGCGFPGNVVLLLLDVESVSGDRDVGPDDIVREVLGRVVHLDGEALDVSGGVLRVAEGHRAVGACRNACQAAFAGDEAVVAYRGVGVRALELVDQRRDVLGEHEVAVCGLGEGQLVERPLAQLRGLLRGRGCDPYLHGGSELLGDRGVEGDLRHDVLAGALHLHACGLPGRDGEGLFPDVVFLLERGGHLFADLHADAVVACEQFEALGQRGGRIAAEEFVRSVVDPDRLEGEGIVGRGGGGVVSGASCRDMQGDCSGSGLAVDVVFRAAGQHPGGQGQGGGCI